MKAGLDAVQENDRKYLGCEMGCKVAGSVNLDEAYRVANPYSNRWDYGVGFSVGKEEFATWIEPHSATSEREVGVMVRKLTWLKDKLSTAEYSELLAMTEKTGKNGYRKYWWVAPGRIGFRKGTSSARQLSIAGLNFPSKDMRIGAKE